MGQFKPEPKMKTTEPSVELKLKKGGKTESPKEHKAEMKALGKVEKQLKTHAGKPASKAHKGLKCGGMTGGIEGRGYKKGGQIGRAHV